MLRQILNGWTVSPIVNLASGLPFTVGSGRDNNLDANSNDRANVTGNPFLDPDRARAQAVAMWFNTAAGLAATGAAQFQEGQPCQIASKVLRQIICKVTFVGHQRFESCHSSAAQLANPMPSRAASAYSGCVPISLWLRGGRQRRAKLLDLCTMIQQMQTLQ